MLAYTDYSTAPTIAQNAASAAVTFGYSCYTATVNDSSVKITENGVHVGDGRWDFESHRIEDCEADLGEDVYDALDAAILSVEV